MRKHINISLYRQYAIPRAVAPGFKTHRSDAEPSLRRQGALAEISRFSSLSRRATAGDHLIEAS
jgi:hypothetical protein